MQTKHTPGPWAYGVRRDGSIWLSLGDRNTGPHYQGDLVASEADARLIVVARELLSIALAVDDLAERIDHDPDSALGELVARARAAIAKATGAEA